MDIHFMSILVTYGHVAEGDVKEKSVFDIITDIHMNAYNGYSLLASSMDNHFGAFSNTFYAGNNAVILSC